jgi:hypothetical protein
VVMVPRSEQLQMLRRHILEEPCTLRLFANDVRPTRALDTMTTLQEPLAELGYTPIDLDPEKWLFTVEPDGEVSATYPEQTFTFTGPQGSVYGWLVMGQRTGRIKMIERPPGEPANISRGGDAIAVIPRLTLE